MSFDNDLYYIIKDHTKYLSQYSRMVNIPTRPILGRELEIDQILASMLRPEISNVILLAEPGVGKSTVVSELARIDEKRCYIEIDISSIMLDIDDVSQLGGVLKGIADEAVYIHDVIGEEVVLFMDEVHLIRKLSEVALESLKPILAESGVRNLKIIMATTFEEFDQYIMANQALTERMQRVNLRPLSKDVVFNILKSFAKRELKEKAEIIEDHLFYSIIELTDRYIPANAQPRKSIDVLDAMIGKYRYDGSRFDTDLLYDILYHSKGVKVELSVDATNIKQRLDSKVYAQGMATRTVDDALQLCLAGLNDNNRPMNTMLFTGSTGTGKTELSKQLALILFDDAKSLIRMDMSEYSSKDSVERFRDELTRKVWERPFSIVLLDEIEKASGEVTRLLLQVLDDARLINRHNKEISFKNCYIILTTNAGSEIYQTIEQYASSDTGDDNISMMRIMPLIKDSIRETSGEGKFPPELLGRIDAIIPFQPLSLETMKKIVVSKIKDMKLLIYEKHGVIVDFHQDVITYITEDQMVTDTNEGGARGVISKLRSNVFNEIAKHINKHKSHRHILVQVVGQMMVTNKNKLISEARIKVVCVD